MKLILFSFVVIIIICFISTAPPTIYLGDSGEIVTAVWTLGIGHPPGYPLYILTGKIFTLIPIGDIAFRVNLFAVFLSLLVFLFLFLNINLFIKIISNQNNKQLFFYVSLIPSLVFIFSETTWFKAINAKGGIYIFSHLIVLMAFFSLLNFILSKNLRYAYLTFYISGFLIPSHISTTLIAFFIVILILYFLKEKINGLIIFKSLILFFSALFLSYLFLFVRVGSNPVLDWAGISSYREVIDHILRKRYMSGGQCSLNILLFRLNNYFSQFVNNYNFLVVFTISGLYFIYTYNKKIFFTILTFLILNTVLLIYGIETSAGFALSSLTTISLYISKGFYLINDLLLIIISGIGLYFAVDFLNKKYSINLLFTFLIFLIIPAIMIISNFEINNHSRKFLGYDHPMNIMKTLNKNDILFSKNDCPSFNILYIKKVKNKFNDFIVYDRDYAVLDISIYNKIIDKKKMREIEIDFILKNSDRVFFTEYFNEKEKNIDSQPYGILFKPYINDIPFNIKTNYLLQLYTIRDYFNNKNLDLFYRDFIAKYFIAKAEHKIKIGKNNEVLKIIKIIEKIGGDSPATLTELIRIIFWGLKDIDLSLKYLKKMVYLNPFDTKTLNILLQTYFKYNFNEALAWIKEFYKHLPNTKYKNEIKKQIELLKQNQNNIVQ